MKNIYKTLLNCEFKKNEKCKQISTYERKKVKYSKWKMKAHQMKQFFKKFENTVKLWKKTFSENQEEIKLLW